MTDEKKLLREIVGTIQARLNEIEKEEMDALLPDGDFDAVVHSVAPEESQLGRRLWRVMFRITGGKYKDRLVHRSYVEEPPTTAFEAVAVAVGAPLERVPIVYRANGPYAMMGLPCVITLRQMTYQGRRYNEVYRVSPSR